ARAPLSTIAPTGPLSGVVLRSPIEGANSNGVQITIASDLHDFLMFVDFNAFNSRHMTLHYDPSLVQVGDLIAFTQGFIEWTGIYDKTAYAGWIGGTVTYSSGSD
ncbi:hypothetical protein, partial [Staphylococcus aureus]